MGSTPIRATRNWMEKKTRDEGHRAPACLGNTRQSVRFRPSRLIEQGGATLGGVTEARRSDKAKAVVQLHPKRLLWAFERLCKGDRCDSANADAAQTHAPLSRGRGVTAAQQTFNLQGEGSSPSDPNFGDKGDQREPVSDVRHPV
jgi:hypothetical protein